MKIEQTIIDNLICNEDFARKVIPFLEKDYFTSFTEQSLYRIIDTFVQTYNKIPNKNILEIAVDKLNGLTEDQYKDLRGRVDGMSELTLENTEWLLDETEKYCRDRALFNAINESIQILGDKKSDISRGIIPELLSKALSISFDTHIGHDYFDDAEARYDFYHQDDFRIPFDIDILNKITKGGLKRKTLNFLIAASGVGKTALMCHFAAANLMHGKNVLYITLEMSEEMISQRIDANLMDIVLDDIDKMPKDVYLKRIESIRAKTPGRLVVQEYPTSSAGASHFRHLLNELKIKKGFVPDIIYVDYLNICASSRIKIGSPGGSYIYVKSIAEEIRALAVEFNVPIVTATQFNRDGYNVTDVDLTATSESMGIVHTADLVLGLISTEELEAEKKIMIKQLKNRYGDMNYYKKFVVGIDKSRMKLFDVAENDNEPLEDNNPSENVPVRGKFNVTGIRM